MTSWFLESALDEELRLEEELALQRARSNLLDFITYVTPDFRVSWHHQMLCGLMDDLIAGRKKRIIISAPPRHAKTTVVSHHVPAYAFGLDPDTRVIAASYAATLSEENNRAVQRIMDSEAYARVFPHTALANSELRGTTKSNKPRNNTTFGIVGHKGTYRCTSTKAGIAGHGGVFLLADDLLRGNDDARSQTKLDGQWEWWNADFRSRLAPGGRICILQTRWSFDDIPGRLQRLSEANPHADQYEFYNLPAIKESPPNAYDPREPGEALWPSQYPAEDLRLIRENDSRTFEALYQGNPVPAGGNLVDDKWWREYTPAMLPPRFDRVVIACDLTFKGTSTGDWCAMLVVGKHEGRAYLLDLVRRQVPFTGQRQLLLGLYERIRERYGVREVLVEDAANGAAIVDVLRVDIPCLIPVPAGQASKEARAQAVTPVIEAGNVYLPQAQHAAWVPTLRTEWAQFPMGRHDDCVDATVIALTRLFPPRISMAGAMPLGVRKPTLAPLIR